MKITDKIRRNCRFKEMKEGDVFMCYGDDSANGPYYYCIKTEPYYEDGETAYNAVNLETGELLYIEANEEIIITTAELIVK